MEFYDIAKNEIFYNNIYLKETSFQVENENGELEEVSGQDTYFLDKLSNEELKELGIAKVSREEAPNEVPVFQEAQENKKYIEESNVYQISYELIDKPLENIKEVKSLQIDEKKQEVISQGFSYQDKVYQCETYDQTLILGKVTQAQLNPNESISWIAKDNTITTFNPQEFVAFATALALFIEQVTFKARSLKDKVVNAKTKEEVEAVVWEE